MEKIVDILENKIKTKKYKQKYFIFLSNNNLYLYIFLYNILKIIFTEYFNQYEI